MTFIVPNPSQLIGAMSPHYSAVVHNSGSAFFLSNGSDFTRIGLIRVPAPRQRVRVRVTTDGSYGAGESLVLSLRHQRDDGTVVTDGLVTLDASNVTGAGTIESQEFDIIIGVGTTYDLQRAYTAGGTPDNPVLSVSVQIF